MAVPTAVGSVPAQETRVGTNVTLDLSGYFSDPDAGNSLTFSATGFPSGTGLSVNSSTGVVSGTPTSADLAASFDVTVAATDEDNRTRGAVVSFIVSTEPAAAQEYYINGSTGNDTWDGSSATFTSGTTGPWKTLTRANTVQPHASGHVDIWVAPGNYRNQPIIPANSGTDDTHRIRYRVNGSGVVYILGPTSGSILFGMQIGNGTLATPTVRNYISVLRESASSYFCLDGEVVAGTDPGEVAKLGAPDTVAKIVRGMTINGTGIEIDMDITRTAGWNGIDVGSSTDLCELAVNYTQHGTPFYSDGNDFGDMVWIPQSLPVGS